jgi:hypothetical protein
VRHWVTADLPRNAVMISNAFGPLLKASTNYSSLMIDFANDKDRTDDSGRKTLQNNSLIIIDGYWRSITSERNSVGRRRRVVSLWRWRWRGIDAASGLVDVNDIHDERICNNIHRLIMIMTKITYPS